MRIACLCPTYRRPNAVASAVWQFLRQELPPGVEAKLFVFDDAGQYDVAEADGFAMRSWRQRSQSFGHKFNELVTWASYWQPDAFAVWEDDDVYLRHHLASHAEQFSKGAAWSIPQKKYTDCHRRPDVPLTELTLADMRVEKRVSPWCHASWAYSRELFEKVGGYPEQNGGFDLAFGARCLAAAGQPANASATIAPQYLYRWQSSGYPNASGFGDAGYDQAKQDSDAEWIGELVPRLDDGARRLWNILGHKTNE